MRGPYFSMSIDCEVRILATNVQLGSHAFSFVCDCDVQIATHKLLVLFFFLWILFGMLF